MDAHLAAAVIVVAMIIEAGIYLTRRRTWARIEGSWPRISAAVAAAAVLAIAVVAVLP